MSEVPQTRPVATPQVAELHQENQPANATVALGCVVAPDSTGGIGSGLADIGQGVISVAGLIPLVGNAADGLNAAISAARGNYGDAALDGVSAIPGAGQVAGIGNIGVKFSRGGAKIWGAVKGVPLPKSKKLPWGFWGDYAKVTVNGREYAKIGDRLYTRHAVDRMTPSGLGRAAGGDAGRSVAPQFVDDVLSSSRATRTPVTGPAGEARLSTQLGSLEVITEGDIVITVVTH